MVINKKDVLLLKHFGLIDDPDTAESVDCWVAADPVAQVFLDRLNPDNEEHSIELSEALNAFKQQSESSLEAYDAGRTQGTLEVTNRIAALVPDLATLPTIVFHDRCSSLGFLSLEKHVDYALSGSPPVVAPVEMHQSAIVDIAGDGRVTIECSINKIPNGLCILILVDVESHRVLSEFPSLKEIDGCWYWSRSVHDIFDEDLARKDVRLMLTVIDKDTRNLIDSDSINRFVASLDAGLQKSLATEFLAIDESEA